MFDELAERSLTIESLGRDETYVCQACHNYLLSNSCTLFSFKIKQEKEMYMSPSRSPAAPRKERTKKNEKIETLGLRNPAT